MRVLASLFLALALCSFLVTLAAAKGSFGSARSFGGGYNRVGKSGYYSQNYRYRTSGMYWIYGSRYYRNRHPANYDGPENRLGTGVYNEDQSRDVLCKRQITYDAASTATTAIDYTSTMTCFKQLYSAPGDPGNVYLEDLMLDKLQWKVDVSGYPTIDLSVFPDKDITEADMSLTLRMRRLVMLPTTTAFTTGGGEKEIDLSSLTWSPCTLEACDGGTTGQFGRPSSRFIDNNRIMTSAVTATIDNAVRVTLRIWLSDDFNEDPFFDHVFFHPANMKIDVSIEAIADPMPADYADKFVGLEAVIASVATDMGSTVSMIKADAAASPVAYDAAKMNRVQFGTFNDISERKAGHFAWFTSTNKNKLCYDETTDAACVRFMDWSSPATTCNEGDNTGVCAGLLKTGYVGRSFRYILQTPVTATYAARFQSHFGFVNPNAVFVAPSSAPVASVMVAVMVTMVAALLAVL